MRVVIDVSFARRGPSGTQVAVDHLVPALEALGVEMIAVEGRTGRHLDPVAEARWQRRLARTDADLLHHPLPAWAPTRRPQLVTVNDLAFEAVPDCFNRRFRLYARHAHRFAAHRAAVVVAPSRATADDVHAFWGITAVVAPYGPGQLIPANRGEPRHFLYVGDDEPRKNLGRLRHAAERSGTLPLVRARGDLADLHRHAAALVLPSLHEGFGFPVLEAMAAGTPVLASDIPALREVCGDAARYCDPRDVQSIAAGLTELATVGPLREELRRRGLQRARQFSWRRCAEAYVAAYRLAIQ